MSEDIDNEIPSEINKNMQLKFTPEEFARRNKQKAIKLARIRAHLQEMKMQKLICNNNGYFLESTDTSHIEVENNIRHQQLIKFRSLLKEKLTENCENTVNEDKENDPYIHDEKHFFELVHKYINTTGKSDPPLYPFIKAIEQYKREYNTDCVRTLPKQLLLKITEGCREILNNMHDNASSMPTKYPVLRGIHGRVRDRGRISLNSNRRCLHSKPKYLPNNHMDCDFFIDYVHESENLHELIEKELEMMKECEKADLKSPTLRYSVTQLKLINEIQNSIPSHVYNGI